MILDAPFSTVCAECGRPVPKGFPVSYDRATLKIRHTLCSEEGRAEIAKNRTTPRPPPNATPTIPPEAFRPDEVPTRPVPLPLDAIPVPEGLSFLGYQKTGIAFALHRKGKGTLIADEMGLGKTAEAIGIIKAQPYLRRVLVICPASLKTNWMLECQKWQVHLPVRIDEGFPKNGIVITNYDQLTKVPSGITWDLVVLDEAQYCKNPKSQRTQHVVRIARHTKQIVALTGTPLENYPLELWPLLQILDPEEWDPPGYFKGKAVSAGGNAHFYTFARRYCNAHEEIIGSYIHPVTKQKVLKKAWNLKGSSNLDELRERLRSGLMIRRLKKDVLAELPPKRRQVIVLPAESTTDGELLDWKRDLDTLPESLTEALALLNTGALPAFRDFSRIRHEQALRKVPYVVDHVKAMFAEGIEKIILFAHHADVLDALIAGLGQFNPACIRGSVDAKDRQGEVEKFQGDKTCKLFVGSLRAAGTGITLTAASHIVFAEIDYNPSVVNQCEDRAHRKGQVQSLLIQIFTQAETLDAHLVRLVVAKQDVIETALDTPSDETMVLG